LEVGLVLLHFLPIVVTLYQYNYAFVLVELGIIMVTWVVLCFRLSYDMRKMMADNAQVCQFSHESLMHLLITE
jgi:hypothetical protein